MTQTIEEKIRQRRRQMLVHSYLYYEKNVNIVSDSTWSRWAVELAELQREYPKQAKQVEFAEEFEDWDGSTGAFLKFGESTITVANRLYEISQKKTEVVKKKEIPKKKKVNKHSATKSLF